MTEHHEADESAEPLEFLLGDFWFGKLFHFEVCGDHPTDPTTADMYAESGGAFFHILTLWNANELGKGTTLRTEWIPEGGFTSRSAIGSLLYGETIRVVQRARRQHFATVAAEVA